MAKLLHFDRDQIPGIAVCVLSVIAFGATVCWARTAGQGDLEESLRVVCFTYFVGMITCALLLWAYLEWKLHVIQRHLSSMADSSKDVVELVQAEEE